MRFEQLKSWKYGRKGFTGDAKLPKGKYVIAVTDDVSLDEDTCSQIFSGGVPTVALYVVSKLLRELGVNEETITSVGEQIKATAEKRSKL